EALVRHAAQLVLVAQVGLGEERRIAGKRLLPQASGEFPTRAHGAVAVDPRLRGAEREVARERGSHALRRVHAARGTELVVARVVPAGRPPAVDGAAAVPRGAGPEDRGGAGPSVRALDAGDLPVLGANAEHDEHRSLERPAELGKGVAPE